MQRYFAKDKFILRESDIHHIKNVMRMRINDEIEVVWDNKLFICKITSFEPFKIEFIREEMGHEINYHLVVGVPLVNEQKMDFILQKLTELGVKEIIPLKMERCVASINEERFIKKKVRWENICKEASEQSKRIDVPIIREMMSLKDLVKENADMKLVASTNEKKMFDNYLQEMENYDKIIVVVGPEGGISDKEEMFLYDNGFSGVSFGNLILRVETACIYVASIFNFFGSKR